ncbi:hypothetical protein B0I37DRAFT_403195 [Chaetomium sp. MPI-CAGE-AT-0009]|nr:hypothetical protein B0I37DRAFT_403195 [Chaetomium sp. MPI-CAGE-AT-0009]
MAKPCQTTRAAIRLWLSGLPEGKRGSKRPRELDMTTPPRSSSQTARSLSPSKKRKIDEDRDGATAAASSDPRTTVQSAKISMHTPIRSSIATSHPLHETRLLPPILQHRPGPFLRRIPRIRPPKLQGLSPIRQPRQDHSSVSTSPSYIALLMVAMLASGNFPCGSSTTTLGPLQHTGRASIPLRYLPTLPLILVHDHQWSLYFAVDRLDRIEVCGALLVGKTNNPPNIYQLLTVLGLLGTWIDTTFRSWVTDTSGDEDSGSEAPELQGRAPGRVLYALPSSCLPTCLLSPLVISFYRRRNV